VSLRGQSGLLGKPVSALAPDVVSAILRDDDESPTALYPTLLGVFCDADGTVIEADIIVNDRVSKPERLEMIRQYARSQGWKCTNVGDFCPECVASAEQVL
jgi:hypothetical protein